MTATERYKRIIRNRLDNPLPEEEYGEIHHIVPRSCGGSDEKENLVRLSAQEHFHCHQLLPTVMKEKGDEEGYKKMLYAWHLMSCRDGETNISSEEFEMLKTEYSKALRDRQTGKHHTDETRRRLSESRKGKSSGMKGKHHTEESNRKNAEKHIGKVPWNKGVFGEGSPMYGKRHSPETIQKMREAAKRRKPISEETRRRLSESHKKYYERKRKEAV